MTVGSLFLTILKAETSTSCLIEALRLESVFVTGEFVFYFLYGSKPLYVPFTLDVIGVFFGWTFLSDNVPILY